MTATMTVPPTIGRRAAKLAVRGIEATSQWDPRAFGRQRLLELPGAGVTFAARGTP